MGYLNEQEQQQLKNLMDECEEQNVILKPWLDLLQKAEQLTQDLETERETTQQALQTSQEWHERQKKEIIEQKDKIIKKLQSEIQQKKQVNQNYLTRIRELEEKNALLQQELDTEKEIQEITTSLENQNLEENSQKKLGIELTAQIKN